MGLLQDIANRRAAAKAARGDRRDDRREDREDRQRNRLDARSDRKDIKQSNRTTRTGIKQENKSYRYGEGGAADAASAIGDGLGEIGKGAAGLAGLAGDIGKGFDDGGILGALDALNDDGPDTSTKAPDWSAWAIPAGIAAGVAWLIWG